MVCCKYEHVLLFAHYITCVLLLLRDQKLIYIQVQNYTLIHDILPGRLYNIVQFEIFRLAFFDSVRTDLSVRCF